MCDRGRRRGISCLIGRDWGCLLWTRYSGGSGGLRLLLDPRKQLRKGRLLWREMKVVYFPRCTRI